MVNAGGACASGYYRGGQNDWMLTGACLQYLGDGSIRQEIKVGDAVE